MKEHNSIGLVAGLVLVTLLLFTLLGPHPGPRLAQAPQAHQPAGFELAGGSTPAR